MAERKKVKGLLWSWRRFFRWRQSVGQSGLLLSCGWMLKETIKLASVRGSSRPSDNKAVPRHSGPDSWKLLYLGCQESWLETIAGWTPLMFDSSDIAAPFIYGAKWMCRQLGGFWLNGCVRCAHPFFFFHQFVCWRKDCHFRRIQMIFSSSHALYALH